MSADLIERLRARESLEALDPKAIYRTRPVALYEEAADALASKDEDIKRLREAMERVKAAAHFKAGKCSVCGELCEGTTLCECERASWEPDLPEDIADRTLQGDADVSR